MRSIASLRGEAAVEPLYPRASKNGIRRRNTITSLAAISLMAACASESGLILDPLTDEQLATATLEIVAGEDQDGVVGDDAPQELVVIVRAHDGTPIPGAPVWWTFSDGEGLAPGAAQTRQTFETATDAAGVVRVEWSLGTIAGDQQAIADLDPPTITGVADAPSAAPGKGRRRGHFRTRAKAAAPAEIVVSVDSVVIDVGEQFNVTGTVLDKYGNEVPDAVIQWHSVDPSVATVGTPSPASFGRIG